MFALRARKYDRHQWQDAWREDGKNPRQKRQDRTEAGNHQRILARSRFPIVALSVAAIERPTSLRPRYAMSVLWRWTPNLLHASFCVSKFRLNTVRFLNSGRGRS